MRWFLGVFSLLLLATAAQARPRDEALAGAFRCSVIADSRQWLDCYYGAAQPVRAGLGLAPALATQVRLASAPPAGGAPRDEDTRDDVMGAAAGCIRVAGDRAWLDCYYSAAAAMRVRLGLQAPVAAPAQSRAAPPPMQIASAAAPAPVRSGPPPMPRSGGMFAGLFSTARPVVRDMPMQSFTFNRRGGVVVTLADGQEWEQIEEDEVHMRASWDQNPSQMQVTITPSMMNTFSMKVGDELGLYKMKRVR
jgi:hypothetical protein